jgi:hypothetical protein
MSTRRESPRQASSKNGILEKRLGTQEQSTIPRIKRVEICSSGPTQMKYSNEDVLRNTKDEKEFVTLSFEMRSMILKCARCPLIFCDDIFNLVEVIRSCTSDF